MDDRTHSAAVGLEIQEDLWAAIHGRVRQAIEVAVEEELEAALGAGRHERTQKRLGYRNGHEIRDVVTETGPTRLRKPRARIFDDSGKSREWRSQLLPRYARRTRRVNEAILGAYLAGANTRRIRRALEPLLGSEFLSKSAISRVVARLKDLFEAWRTKDLSDKRVVFLYLDGMRLPVRMARRVVSVPIQAALGVREDGTKELLTIAIAPSESTPSWTAVLEDLARRGLKDPVLVILDGNPGLSRAVQEVFPKALRQRCTRHKLENLLAKAPKHCHGEITRDYRAITHAASAEAARRGYQAFLRKWSKILPEVARSLEEAGEELLTFTRFPKSQWKSLRTTNHIERLNGEFRRRTKTQGSFSTETAALVLLFGLVAFGQIRLRKIDGHQQMGDVMKNFLPEAA